MVEEVSKWHHHGGGERPAEAARTGIIVHQHKVLFGCSAEQVGVERQDLRYLVPFNHDLISVSLGFSFELIVP